MRDSTSNARSWASGHSGAAAKTTVSDEQDAGDPAGCSYVGPGNRVSTSQYRGVCWNKKNKRWQSSINTNGRYLYLGSYDTEDEAAAVFDKAAVRIRRHRARLNRPIENYVDEDGNILLDLNIERLLLDACSPKKPRRMRAYQRVPADDPINDGTKEEGQDSADGGGTPSALRCPGLDPSGEVVDYLDKIFALVATQAVARICKGTNTPLPLGGQELLDTLETEAGQATGATGMVFPASSPQAADDLCLAVHGDEDMPAALGLNLSNLGNVSLPYGGAGLGPGTGHNELLTKALAGMMNCQAQQRGSTTTWEFAAHGGGGMGLQLSQKGSGLGLQLSQHGGGMVDVMQRSRAGLASAVAQMASEDQQQLLLGGSMQLPASFYSGPAQLGGSSSMGSSIMGGGFGVGTLSAPTSGSAAPIQLLQTGVSGSALQLLSGQVLHPVGMGIGMQQQQQQQQQATNLGLGLQQANGASSSAGSLLRPLPRQQSAPTASGLSDNAPRVLALGDENIALAGPATTRTLSTWPLNQAAHGLLLGHSERARDHEHGSSQSAAGSPGSSLHGTQRKRNATAAFSTASGTFGSGLQLQDGQQGQRLLLQTTPSGGLQLGPVPTSLLQQDVDIKDSSAYHQPQPARMLHGITLAGGLQEDGSESLLGSLTVARSSRTGSGGEGGGVDSSSGSKLLSIADVYEQLRGNLAGAQQLHAPQVLQVQQLPAHADPGAGPALAGGISRLGAVGLDLSAPAGGVGGSGPSGYGLTWQPLAQQQPQFLSQQQQQQGAVVMCGGSSGLAQVRLDPVQFHSLPGGMLMVPASVAQVQGPQGMAVATPAGLLSSLDGGQVGLGSLSSLTAVPVPGGFVGLQALASTGVAGHAVQLHQHAQHSLQQQQQQQQQDWAW